MQCPRCNAETVAGATFCHQCGQRLLAAASDAPKNTGNADVAQSTPAESLNQSIAARGQQQETELWRGRYSAKAMYSGWILCGLISLVAIAAGIVWASTAMHWLIVLAVILLPWLYCASILTYRWMSYRYLLTNQRFMHEHGILRRIHDRIELLDIDDISCEQGIVDRLFGVGTIRIVSSDRNSPGLMLNGIDRALDVATTFDNARLAERRRRGLFVEQV